MDGELSACYITLRDVVTHLISVVAFTKQKFITTIIIINEFTNKFVYYYIIIIIIIIIM